MTTPTPPRPPPSREAAPLDPMTHPEREAALAAWDARYVRQGILSYTNRPPSPFADFLQGWVAALECNAPRSPAEPVAASCADCGLLYASEAWADVTIPHAEWAKIAPRPDGNGLLCFNCMNRRAVTAGIECEAVIRSGPFAYAIPPPAAPAATEAEVRRAATALPTKRTCPECGADVE